MPVRLVARELRSRGKVDSTPSQPTISWLHLLRLKDDFGGRNICLVVELRGRWYLCRYPRSLVETATTALEDEDEEDEDEEEGKGEDDDKRSQNVRADCLFTCPRW